MADMVNTIVMLGSIFGISILVFIVVLKKFTPSKSMKLKDFKMKTLGESTYAEMKKKIEQHGNKMPFFKSGRLMLGINHICHIDRWMEIKGKFASIQYSFKKKELMFSDDTSNDVKYDFLILRARNKKFIPRWLGIKKSYYILKAKNEKDEPAYYYDDKDKRFLFKERMDMQSYGDVWISSNEAQEYIDNLSIKRMCEQIMMLVEYIPDKAAHLEIEQAQKERLARVLTDLEKGKYEDVKKADQTVVS